jgi:hypothetical protein
MALWTSQSNPLKQMAISAASSVVGLFLTIGFRDFGTLNSNAGAGFMLGLLLLALGSFGIVVTGRQTVVIDPDGRRITIEESSPFGTKKRTIPFGHVIGVTVGYLGKRSNFVTVYYLVLKLRSGEEYPLFAPGRFFEGSSDRSTVEEWQRRLDEHLGRQG